MSQQMGIISKMGFPPLFCVQNPTESIGLSICIQKVVNLTLGLQFDGACFGNPKE